MNVREATNNKGDQMFYWVYTKKGSVRPIISRNLETSRDAVKFGIKNGKDWIKGEMFTKGIRMGEFKKGKIRIGSNLKKSK